MMPYHHINLCERKVIKKMRKLGKSIREIAKILGFHPSTISRELKRNRDLFWYNPYIAQEKYTNRRKNSRSRYIDQK